MISANLPSLPPLQKNLLSSSNDTASPCFSELRSWRNQHARQLGFAPYIIASNALLREIVIKHPQSLSELLDIKGFGKKKAQNFGKAILEILKKYPREKK